MKKQKWRPWRYFNPRNIMTEIHVYGYHYSASKYIKLMLLAFCGTGIIGYCFQLKWAYIMGVMAVFLLLLPAIILTMYRNMYEQKKFVDIGNYLEQILFSFKRHSKILSTLQDTLTLFPDGNLNIAIKKAVHHIQVGVTSGNIYKEALKEIEEEYGCKTVSSAHRFFTNVEMYGGTYEDAADILIADRNRWVTRVYETQKEKQAIKRNMSIAIFFSFLIIGSTVLLLPNEFTGVKDNPLSQIATMVVMILNLCIWTYVQCKLSGSWICAETEAKSKDTKRYYEIVMNQKDKGKKGRIVIAAGMVSVAAVSFAFTKEYSYSVILLVITYLFATNKKRLYKKAKKKLTREVEKAFPEWMLSLSLLLQSDNVHVSISRTVGEAPAVLQGELRQLLAGMESKPNSLEPYLAFFERLEVPDVKSTMKMLYSMARYGTGDMKKQISALVERNSIMLDRAERMKMEDYLAGMGFFILAPMLIGSIKMLMDMLLLVMNLLTMTGGI